jgi:hypothetical protein
MPGASRLGHRAGDSSDAVVQTVSFTISGSSDANKLSVACS